MALTILEGSTFCICDDRGDVGEETSGFFAHDTRFLSVLRVTINGKRPLLLSSAQVEYFSAAFYLRNPLAGGLPQDTLSIIRRRFVGEGMQERIMLRNEGMEPISFTLGLEIGCDFADIMSVKEHDFALGDPVHAKPLPPPVSPEYDAENNQFVLADPEDAARTQVILSERGTTNGSGITYEIELAPRGSWDLQLDVVPSLDGSEVAPKLVERRFGDELVHVRDSLAAWQLRVPQLRAGWEDLEHAFFDGVAIASGFLVSGRLGVLLFLAVLLHKLPEGVTVASVMVAGGAGRGRAIGAAAVLGLATILGVLLTTEVAPLARHGLALSGGVTLYVAASNLVPEFQAKRGWITAAAFFGGAVAFFVTERLLAQWMR